jgi:hypothetical protein
MRVRTALLLLLTLVFTLGFGVHPCGAMKMEQKTAHPAGETQAAPAMPSCHSHTAPAPAQAGEDGRGGSEGTSEHHCPHLCHATALPAVTPPPFLTTQVVAELTAGHVESAPAAPARSIDHVPLP